MHAISIRELVDKEHTGELAVDALKSDDFLRALETFIVAYKEEHQKKDVPAIPLSLFSNRQLGVLEVTVKYLKEHAALSYSQMARLLNRNDRTMWAAYHRAMQKQKKPFPERKDDHHVPCTIFADRLQGPLEALVLYLKNDIQLSFKTIATMLNRSYRTIWLTYKNGEKKHER